VTAHRADDALLAFATELRVAMSRLGRQTRVSSTGLTPSQLSALTTLEECGPLRLNELAAREGVAAPTMSRGVDILEQSRLVRRRRDPDDARSSFIELTDNGRAVLTKAIDQRTTLLAQRLGDLEPAQLAAIKSALPALRQLVDKPVEPASGVSARRRGTAR
jgi:DNA-binding MarR family transcriptional regulator